MRAHLCHDLPLLHVLLHGSIQRAPTEQVEAEEVAREDVRVVGGAWADMESGPRFALGPPRGFEPPTVHKGAGPVTELLESNPPLLTENRQATAPNLVRDQRCSHAN